MLYAPLIRYWVEKHRCRDVPYHQNIPECVPLTRGRVLMTSFFSVANGLTRLSLTLGFKKGPWVPFFSSSKPKRTRAHFYEPDLFKVLA